MKTEAFDEVGAFLAWTRDLDDPLAIGRQFDVHLRRHALGMFSLDLVDMTCGMPGSITGLWNCPNDWAEHYLHHGYVRIDPFVAAGCGQRSLFNWFDVLAHRELSEASWRMVHEAAAFGIGIGVTIPIHRPDGLYAAVSITADQDVDPTAEAIRIHAPLLNLLAFALFERAAHLIRGRQLNIENTLGCGGPGEGEEDRPVSASPAAPVVPFLSRIELDCLAWLSCGLSVWDVSERVGESASRTRRLLASVERRLAVSNPAHAMVRALDLGVLRL